MRLVPILLTTFLCCVQVANAQIEDDDFDDMFITKSKKEWRWKYHAVAKAEQRDGGQIIDIELDMYLDYEKEEALKRAKDYQRVAYGSTVSRPMPVGGNDSLVLLKPYTAGTGTEATFSVVKATLLEGGDRKVLQYQLRSIAGPAIVAGDIVALRVAKLQYDKSLLFYQVEDLLITLLDASKKVIELPVGDKAAYDMACVKMLQADMKDAAAFYKDKLTSPLINTGAYAGKTITEILNAATDKNVIDFVNFMVSYPRKYMGHSFKFVEIYASWILNGKPTGDLPGLLVEKELDRWTKMAPMEVDLLAGTVNGTPLQKAMNDWLMLFPFYDGDEKDYEDQAHAYYDYSLLGNGLTYFPDQKALKILIVNHQYIKGPELLGLSPAAVVQKLGRPAKVIGDPKAPEAYLYERPYGTLHVNFSMSFEGWDVNLLYLYPVKPALVKLADL